MYIYTPFIFNVCRNTLKGPYNFLFLKSHYLWKKAAAVLGIGTDQCKYSRLS